ncbi:MAG TPA: lasso peptide biosynthesis B2 protein [Allosphingosinicella sp.]|nr:lasso peptide biosynthesis B2 protein [Allosphingosinicella sp.]
MSARAPASRLARLRPADWAALAEAGLTLALGSAAIKLLSFRRVAAWASTGGRPAARNDAAKVRRVRWAVEAWARRVPWRAVCFQRGLAVHLMLRRRGIASVMRYGVADLPDKGLQAHVWVDVGEDTVIGGEEAPNFACVARFPPEAA